MSGSSSVLRLHDKPAVIAGKLTTPFMRAVLAPHPISRITPKKEHNLPMKSPDSKYLIDAPAFSEHRGREWPTNKTTDIYLSAINLQRSPFNTSDMRLFPRSMEASGGPQKLC